MNIQVYDIVRISLEPHRRPDLARAGEMGAILLASEGYECQVLGIKHLQYDDDRMRSFSLRRKDGVRILCSSVDFMFLRHGQAKIDGESSIMPNVGNIPVKKERMQLELFGAE